MLRFGEGEFLSLTEFLSISVLPDLITPGSIKVILLSFNRISSAMDTCKFRGYTVMSVMYLSFSMERYRRT
jgi:hypothetical protein